MLSQTMSAAILGVKAVPIRVEVDISTGLPAFDIVGLPDKAVRESRKRVRSAIKNSSLDFPVKKITINLAPADIKKIGPHFDLAIAAGILSASGVIRPKKENLTDYIMAGELSLGGEIRKIKGVLPMALRAARENKTGIIVPQKNYGEAALVEEIEVIPIENIKQLIRFMNRGEIPSLPEKKEKNRRIKYEVDFAEIKGQNEARRALEVAAAGSHNLLMIGPPGSGKTMMARRLRTILPPLSEEEALELTKIYSIMGLTSVEESLIRERPFRTPHHNISKAGLIGGGRIPQPGEVSLAHRGTLFLDEMPEFNRDVLETLRQPLEEGKVTIIRSEMKATFPADFMLVTAMNPCPCGYYGDDRKNCHCSSSTVNRYRNKVSGPLMDRIDIHVHVPALSVDEMSNRTPAESSKEIRTRVLTAQDIQIHRYGKEKFSFNSSLNGKKIKQYCKLNSQGQKLLTEAVEELGLSARAYDRILRLARTISDLSGRPEMELNPASIAEAIQYRSLDRRVQL